MKNNPIWKEIKNSYIYIVCILILFLLVLLLVSNQQEAVNQCNEHWIKQNEDSNIINYEDLFKNEDYNKNKNPNWTSIQNGKED